MKRFIPFLFALLLIPIGLSAITSARKPSYFQTATLTHTSHPRYRGVVAHWVLNESGGLTAYDISGNGNHGTLTNGPTWTQGQFGPTVQLDSVDDHILGPNITSYFSAQQGTLSLWVKLALHTPIDSTKTGSWWLSINTSSHYPWTDGLIYDGTFRTIRVDGITSLVSDRTQWTHIVITRDANAWIFYENAKVTTSQAPGTWGMSIDFAIGQSENPTYHLNGLIDDVRIYNRALSADEVMSLYADSFLEWRRKQNLAALRAQVVAAKVKHRVTQQ